jgi:hypothetical protein
MCPGDTKIDLVMATKRLKPMNPKIAAKMIAFFFALSPSSSVDQ